MGHYQEIVLLFTRYPAPGLSKTRLIPVLGTQGAADLQKRMTERILARISLIARERPLDLEIHYDGSDPHSMREWLGDHFYVPQVDGNLGWKMEKAVSAHLRAGRGILLTGSDCPGANTTILREALTAITRHDLVIGPAYDGGYYLIGINGGMDGRTVHALFSDIPWGTATVFRATMNRAANNHLSTYLLPTLHDIDRPEDLGYLDHYTDAE